MSMHKEILPLLRFVGIQIQVLLPHSKKRTTARLISSVVLWYMIAQRGPFGNV